MISFSKNEKITYICKNTIHEIEMDMLIEEPLLVHLQDEAYSVIMRTPGDEQEQIAGFCLVEGLVDKISDFENLNFINTNTNIANVWLTKDRYELVSNIVKKRGFIKQTSSSIIPKDIVHDLNLISVKDNNTQISLDFLLKSLIDLNNYQPVRKITKASHAAAIYDTHLNIIDVKEDVGRHNAFDKVIGSAFLSEQIDKALIGVLSSRVSYDMVQKAARCGLSILLSVSRPTSLAVKLAKELGMTLACLSKDEGIYIFCGKKRINL